MITYQNNLAFGKIGLLKTWSIHHHETNQCCDLPIQTTSRLHEDLSNVSCFLVWTVSCIHHPMMGFGTTFINKSQWWTRIWSIFNFKLFNQQLQYLVHWKGYIWYMALVNALGNLLNIYQMPSTRWKKFINTIQTNPRSFFMEHIAKRRGDVMNDIANIIMSIVNNIIISTLPTSLLATLLVHS